MKKFICDICNKEFARKAHLDSHKLKKKNPCIQTINSTIQLPSKTIRLPLENNLMDKDLSCIYCSIVVSRKDVLTKHINKHCKVKKNLDIEKEKIFNLLVEKDNIINKKNKENEELKLLIKEQNDKINKILEKVSIKNINKGVINNITILSNKLETEDISKIDTTVFTSILNKYGRYCFLQITDKIYNNKNNLSNI
jgi:hypothetical protein